MQVTSFKRLFAASVCLLAFNLPARAGSIQIVGDTAIADQSSVIRLGKPLDCSVDACAAKADPGEAPASGALVDAFGMPTRLPTILRGGQSADDTLIFSKEDKPAVVPVQGQSETPPSGEPQPVTVVEPQGMPEDAAHAPADIKVN